MIRNYTAPTLLDLLPQLSIDVLVHGRNRKSRAGDVKELPAVGITLEQPLARYLPSPARGASLPAMIAETAWVLAGRNDIEFLSHYLLRAPQFSDDGETWRAGYGPRLRAFGGSVVDQLAAVIRKLQDPSTRQAVISLWDPDEDNGPEPTKDTPCNNWLHFAPSPGGSVDLYVSTRSNDLIWGWSGINTFEWSVLLEVVAKLTGLAPGAIHYSISSLHIYAPYQDKAKRIAEEVLTDETALLSRRGGVRFTTNTVEELDDALDDFFRMEKIIREGRKTAEDRLMLIRETQPDQMFREWLMALEYFWNGGGPNILYALTPAVADALKVSPRPKAEPKPPKRTKQLDSFAAEVSALHIQKNRAYGSSWKRRGELVSILANIARKIDRLDSGVATSDESQVDTAIDLWVYLLKYREWLQERLDEPEADSDDESRITKHVWAFVPREGFLSKSPGGDVVSLCESFESLQDAVIRKEERADTLARVESMLILAGNLAWGRWEAKAKAQWQQANAGRSWKGYDES